jgi:hypothetical protein
MGKPKQIAYILDGKTLKQVPDPEGNTKCPLDGEIVLMDGVRYAVARTETKRGAAGEWPICLVTLKVA